MSLRRLTVALAVFAVALGAVTSSVLAAGNQVQKTTIKVTALDTLKFTLSKKSAPHGVVSFVITNKGNLKHDFKIAGKKTPLLAHNQTKTLTVTLKKGKFPYQCTVPGHASAGMKGTFTAT